MTCLLYLFCMRYRYKISIRNIEPTVIPNFLCSILIKRKITLRRSNGLWACEVVIRTDLSLLLENIPMMEEDCYSPSVANFKIKVVMWKWVVL